MKVRPLRDEFIVQTDVQGETTKGGIVIPFELIDKPITGTVIAVGPGTVDAKGREQKSVMKIGDRILFGPKEGKPIGFDDYGNLNRSMLIMNDKSVIAKVV